MLTPDHRLVAVKDQREAGYSGFSSVSDYNLYCYQAASVRAVKEGVPYYEMARSMVARTGKYTCRPPEQSSWDRGKIYRSMGREGIKIISRDPVTYFLIHARGMVRTLIDPGVTEYLIMFKRYSWSGGLLGQLLIRVVCHVQRLRRHHAIFFFCLLTLTGYI